MTKMSKKIKVVQCWDDGVGKDEKTAEICRKYGATASFNLNASFHSHEDFWDKYETAKQGKAFYFWGHSYELINDEMWEDYEEKIKRISEDPDAEWGEIADLV